MNIFYRLSVDLANSEYVAGWCVNRLRKGDAVNLEFYQNGKFVGEATANRYREDLRELGVHPSGRCGFELVFDCPLLQLDQYPLTVKVKDSGKSLAEMNGATVLARSSILPDGFRHFFSKSRVSGKRAVHFMHIPKTAGTSFNTSVRSLYPTREVISHIEALNPDDYLKINSRYIFISGHVYFGVFKKYFLEETAGLYSLIREPYAHLHSHLNWVVSASSDRRKGSFKRSNKTIYELGQKVKQVDFTRIEEIEMFVEEVEGAAAAFFDNMQTRHFLEQPVSEVEESDLLAALKNTRYFRLIGMTEYYLEFLKIFAEINKLPQPVMKSSLNRSKSIPLYDTADKAVRKALYPLVRYDLELYAHVSNLWRETL